MTRQLAADHTDELAARRQLAVNAEQLLDRQRVSDVVSQRRQVIQPVGVRDELRISEVLRDLLVPAMQVTYFGPGPGNDLAVQFEDDAQHAVRGRVRGPHVQDHLLALKLVRVLARWRPGLARFRQPCCRFFELNVSGFSHAHFLGSIGPGPCGWPCASLISCRRSRRALVSRASVSGIRTRGSRAIVSLPPAMVTNGPPSSGAALVKATSGTSDRLARQRKVLPQWKVGIAFPHQDPAQVRVATETESHHVVNLALMPIRRPPYAGDRRQFALFLAYLGLEPKPAKMTVAVKMIDDREARIVAVIVHAGDIHQVVKAQLRFGKGANLRHPLGVGHPQRDLAPKFDRLRH